MNEKRGEGRRKQKREKDRDSAKKTRKKTQTNRKTKWFFIYFLNMSLLTDEGGGWENKGKQK